MDATPSNPSGWTSLRASIRPLSSREALQAGLQAGETAYEVTIPYRAGLKPQWRISWTTNGDQLLRIRGVLNPRMKNRWLVLTCAEFLDET